MEGSARIPFIVAEEFAPSSRVEGLLLLLSQTGQWLSGVRLLVFGRVSRRVVIMEDLSWSAIVVNVK